VDQSRRSVAHMTITSQKTANSLLWSGIESGSLAIISFATLVVYSRLLSESEFGLFSIILAIMELLGILVTMPFHDALVQRHEVSERSFDTAFSVTIALSLVLMLVCWAAAPLFSRMVGRPDAALVFASSALVFPCTAPSATIVARQRRDFLFRSLAVRSLVGRITGGVIGIVSALLNGGVWSLVAQQLVTALVGSLVLWFSCEHKPRLGFRMLEFRQLVGFGIFAVANLFLSFSVKRLFTIVAGLMLGIATAGYLNLGFRIVDVLWAVLATGVSQVALPMLSGLQSDPERIERAYKKAVEFACLCLYPCFAGIAVTAPEIVQTVFGERWTPAVPCIVALSGLTLVLAPRLYVTPMLTALGRPKDTVVGVAAELVFMLVAAALLGMPSLGWAIGIWVASECVQVPITVVLLRRATGYSTADQFAGVRTPLAAVTVLILGAYLFRASMPPDLAPSIRLAAIAVIGAATYAAAVIVLDRRLASSFLGFVRSAFGGATR
jgi:O-antigen/teichoic acid export membrane protein